MMKIGRFQKFYHLDSQVDYNCPTKNQNDETKRTSIITLRTPNPDNNLYKPDKIDRLDKLDHFSNQSYSKMTISPVLNNNMENKTNKSQSLQSLYSLSDLRQKTIGSVPKIPYLKPIAQEHFQTEDQAISEIHVHQNKYKKQISYLTNASKKAKHQTNESLRNKQEKTTEDLDNYLHFLKINGSTSTNLNSNIQDELKNMSVRFKEDFQHKKINLDLKKKKAELELEEAHALNKRSRNGTIETQKKITFDKEKEEFASLPSIIFKRQKTIIDFVTEQNENLRTLPTKLKKHNLSEYSSNQSLDLVRQKMYQRNAAEQWQQAYTKKNKQNVIELKQTIQQFVNAIEGLMQMWKNSTRVRKFIESLLSNQPDLGKLLVPSDGILNIMQTPSQIEKLFFFKEMVHLPDNIIYVTKQNFSYTPDFQRIIQNILDVKKNYEVQQIQALQLQMVKDLNAVKTVEAKYILKKQTLDLQVKDPNTILGVNLFKESQLSYFSPLMHNQTKDLMLNKIEKVYGNLPLLKCETREVNILLNQWLKNLVSVDGG